MSFTTPDADRQPDRINAYFSSPTGKEDYAALLEFAEREIRLHRWCIRIQDKSMPGGRTAADVLNGVLHAVLADPGDKLRRNIPDDVEIGHGLKCIIESKINHASKSFENRHRQDNVGINPQGEPVDRLDTATPFWDPLTASIPDDELAAMGADCARFIEFAKKDKNVYGMLVLIRDRGIDKPVERIAKELGLKITDVFLARKRLRTLVRKFQRTEDHA